MNKNIYILAVMVLSIIRRANSLEIAVIPIQEKFSQSETVRVILQLNNTNSQELLILPWYFPGEELTEPIFDVRCNEKSARYVGKLMKRVAPKLKQVIHLLPGQSISTKVNVSSSYRMDETCNYRIRFKPTLERILFKNNDETQEKDKISDDDYGKISLSSVSTRVYAEGRPDTLIPFDDGTLEQRASGIRYWYCSAGRKSKIPIAFAEAESYARDAVNYLSTTVPSSTQRFSTWYGTYTLQNWNIVKNKYTKIYNTLANKFFEFDCFCNDPGIYAYVYPDSPYRIYLCGAFWAAPVTGTDSRAGTIIHETSHFNAVIGTDDHAYGHSRCKNLAKANPTRARDNADTFEYFGENTPSLP